MVSRILNDKLLVAVDVKEGDFKYFNESELYQYLTSMNEFDRMKLIKEINKSYGYELVNYKILNFKCGGGQVEVENDEIDIDLSKEYRKAYMKLLSTQ